MEQDSQTRPRQQQQEQAIHNHTTCKLQVHNSTSTTLLAPLVASRMTQYHDPISTVLVKKLDDRLTDRKPRSA
eukprot:scaffold260_cov134-Skeletonema_menzelii.AAC.2